MSYAIIRNTKEKIWKEYLGTMKEGPFFDISFRIFSKLFYTIQSLQNLQNARECGIINIMAIAMLKPL